MFFAAGNGNGDMVIEVRWRSGKASRIEDAKSNRIYEIDEVGAVPAGALGRQSVGASERDRNEFRSLLRCRHAGTPMSFRFCSLKTNCDDGQARLVAMMLEDIALAGSQLEGFQCHRDRVLAFAHEVESVQGQCCEHLCFRHMT